MSPVENQSEFARSPSGYILDNFAESDRIAMLVLNRHLGEAIQRITSAQKAASPGFQSWLRYKNANGSDIYIGMNPLRQDAVTRTKRDVKSIRHAYLDLDYGGAGALRAIGSSKLVPAPNYVLTSSPGKFQIIWKVEGMTLEGAEGLLRALASEFGGDPAATDATRVLRMPGFANKKYQSDFYVEARREATKTYHLGDFKLPIDYQGSPRHNFSTNPRRKHANLSQSEYDWAFAKRALARGDDPGDVTRQIAEHRANDKWNPEYYARLTVAKALAELRGVVWSPSGSPSPARDDGRAKRRWRAR